MKRINGLCNIHTLCLTIGRRMLFTTRATCRFLSPPPMSLCRHPQALRRNITGALGRQIAKYYISQRLKSLILLALTPNSVIVGVISRMCLQWVQNSMGMETDWNPCLDELKPIEIIRTGGLEGVSRGSLRTLWREG